MLSTIVKMPTKIMLVSPGLNIIEKKKINDERPAVAAFRCLPVSTSPCSLHSAAPTMQNSAALAVGRMDNGGALPGGLRPDLMPKHVAIIMDGHGRWAKERGLPTEKGHHAGLDNLKYLILSACSKFRIRVLTVYAFSTENWNRSQAEIDFLMSSFENFVRSYIMELIHRYDLRFSVIGDKSRLPPSLQSTISVAEESSKANKGMHFITAMNYSGRLDIAQACKKIASKVEDGILRAKDVNEETLQQQLMTSLVQVPDPDLLIRTSAEKRMSNFLLWQLANTEFYFTYKMFPDLEGSDLVQALTIFQSRKIRYGRRQVEVADN